MWGTELAALPFGYVVLVAYWTVLVAELVGDKAIYTAASLVLRFRAGIVFGAMTMAFAGKMLAAVLLGKAMAQVHSPWVEVLSAAAFFFSALCLWFKKPEPIRAEPARTSNWPRAAGVCFAALFLTEWGDPGQIAAAALAVKSPWLWATWLGGTLAMVTKGGLAMAVGRKLRDRLPQRMLRTLASASCCLLGILALSGIVLP